jgi:hypothetical protein
MKITRRTLLTSVAATAAVAQTPPPPEARVDVNRRNAEAIAKVPLPQSTEPAFTFKA